MSRQQKKPTHANRHQLTSTDTFSHLQTTPGRVLGCQGVSVCLCSLQIVHEQCLGNVLGVLDCICMVSLDVYNVWMCLRDYLGAHPLQNGEFTPLRHSPERQYFLQLAILKHQNIKMSRYILNKNGWVLPFFSFLVSVRAKLKNTFTWITLYLQSEFGIVYCCLALTNFDNFKNFRHF